MKGNSFYYYYFSYLRIKYDCAKIKQKNADKDLKQEWSEIYSNWQSKPDQKNPHHYRCNSHQNFYRNEIKLVWILQKQKINITKKKIKTKRWQTTRQIMSKPILFEAITLTADMNHGDRQQSKKSEKTWYHEGSKTGYSCCCCCCWRWWWWWFLWNRIQQK